MNKNNISEALKTISQYAHAISIELKDGLPGGQAEEMSYDEQLVEEIAKAFKDWQNRMGHIKNPYCVWYYNGSEWSKATKDMYQEDAYREWYRLTSGGRKDSKSTFINYYFLAPSNAMPIGRHEQEESQDDLSIRYLLNKSFGD